MEIRIMQPKDLPQVESIWNAAVNDGEVLYYPLTDAYFQQKFLQSPGCERENLLVAERDGAVIGFLHGVAPETFPLARPGCAYLTCLITSPECRGQGVGKALLNAFKAAYPDAYEGRGEGHCIEYTYEGHKGCITVPNPKMQLAVGTLQSFLDEYLKENGGEIDYIHGEDVTDELGSKPGNIGFKLPAMGKDQLFKTIISDCVLPRKTFSMGHAQDKRYYVEARKIK